MSLLQAILIGLIYGLTEFLPISSSGHLAFAHMLLETDANTGILFQMLLHVSVLLAVCGVYYKDMFRLLAEGFFILRDVFANIVLFFRNKGKEEHEPYRKLISSGYRKFAVLLLMSAFPSAILGFVASDVVKMASELLLVPGIGLIVMAILLFAANRAKDGEKLPRNLTYTNAFVIGIVQGVAALPGLSGTGVTMIACLFSGFQRNFAAKYAFLMSIPVALLALFREGMQVSELTVEKTSLAYCVVGMLVAAIVGYICIKMMLIVIRKKRFTVFAVYCLLAGAFFIGAHFYMI
ncbi:MAG: undecaprenyl-diphosphate phosphatase [Roseburia sp.]